MMGVSRIPPTKLHQRLDAIFYSQLYLDNEAALLGSGLPLREVGSCCSKCNCGATPKRVVYSKSGTPLIRGGEIRPEGFHFDKVVRTADINISADSSVAALAGDLVYTMSGHSLGDAAVVCGSTETFSFTNTVVRARFKSDVDSHFAAAFFNCKFGWLNSRRHSSGGDRGHVMPNVFRRLRLPVPHADAQAYVGDKVRLAETLRAQALKGFSAVQAENACRYPAFSPTARGKRAFRMPAFRLRDNLLANAYPQEVESYFFDVEHMRLADICETIYSGSTRPNSNSATAVEQATCRSCSGAFIKRPCNMVVPPARSTSFLKPHDIILTNAAHDKAYIGKDYTYFHGGPRNYPSTKVMVVRVDRTRASPAFVHHVLRGALGYVQTQAAVRGITAGIRPEDIGEIRVPVPAPSGLDAKARTQEERLVSSATMREEASQLTKAATVLVDALIERQVTEADLIAAGKTPEADRALLARLTEAGLDAPDSPPLFPDLDRLAELLTEAQAEASE